MVTSTSSVVFSTISASRIILFSLVLNNSVIGRNSRCVLKNKYKLNWRISFNFLFSIRMSMMNEPLLMDLPKAIEMLRVSQGFPPLSESQVKMFEPMVMKFNSVNQLPTGTGKGRFQ